MNEYESTSLNFQEEVLVKLWSSMCCIQYLQLSIICNCAWPQEMQVEFTNLHEKAVLLQILRAGRNPFGHHEHIGW